MTERVPSEARASEPDVLAEVRTMSEHTGRSAIDGVPHFAVDRSESNAHTCDTVSFHRWQVSRGGSTT